MFGSRKRKKREKKAASLQEEAMGYLKDQAGTATDQQYAVQDRMSNLAGSTRMAGQDLMEQGIQQQGQQMVTQARKYGTGSSQILQSLQESQNMVTQNMGDLYMSANQDYLNRVGMLNQADLMVGDAERESELMYREAQFGEASALRNMNEQEKQRNADLFGGLIQGAATVGGFLLGGPVGAAAGASITGGLNK